jgi:PAS domain-containing protein
MAFVGLLDANSAPHPRWASRQIFDETVERRRRACSGKISMYPLPFNESVRSPEDANLLATAIVDTVREPILVLDADLQIIFASRSFYLTFDSTRLLTQGKKFCDIDDRVWNIADLRQRLEKIAPAQDVMEGFEVERDFPRSLEDVTERRRSECALQKFWSSGRPCSRR